ncbi:MAG: nucleotidyl transferase AbiEii/AbiGii toxin family protein [Patescibacteria group bacterium]|nr:nucleotidyl transferase AbiEii/AbiGii toxin family protein [Patescibacteria group bacterium]
MITKDQLTVLAKEFKTNEATVLREYLQVWFLSRLYSFNGSEQIFFKGGTALHLIFGAPRFSEDLDFTVQVNLDCFDNFIKSVFATLFQEEEVEFKEKKTLSGRRFLLTAKPSGLNYPVFINLDFSFREKVLSPEKSIIKTEFPVLFTSYIYHLSAPEILAEKIRAIMTRKKGRDLYDLWFLASKNILPEEKLVKEKLRYYGLEKITEEEIFRRIETFPKKEFVLDLRPFVPLNEREKLEDFFDYLKDYLSKTLEISS